MARNRWLSSKSEDRGERGEEQLYEVILLQQKKLEFQRPKKKVGAAQSVSLNVKVLDDNTLIQLPLTTLNVCCR